jgi:hypothetical protein
MIDGVPGFNLLIVLKDGEAKADVLSESDTTADARLSMDPGLLLTKPEIKVSWYISSNTDADTLCR